MFWRKPYAEVFEEILEKNINLWVNIRKHLAVLIHGYKVLFILTYVRKKVNITFL